VKALNLAEVWSQTLNFLWEKLPWFISLLIALLIYEAAKKGARGLVSRVGERLSARWYIAVLLMLMALLIVVLRVQGYI